MLKVATIAMLIATLGCATESKITYHVDPELEPYVWVFEQVYQQKAEFNVVLVRSADNMAWCQRTSRTIGVDLEFFMRATDEQIEEVILHEFGHCQFNRRHNDEIFPYSDGANNRMAFCPVSIMTSKVLASSNHCYREFREYYLHELNHP